MCPLRPAAANYRAKPLQRSVCVSRLERLALQPAGTARGGQRFKERRFGMAPDLAECSRCTRPVYDAWDLTGALHFEPIHGGGHHGIQERRRRGVVR